MKYVVLSPKGKLICFDHSDQVEEYCLEKNNEALDNYCAEQDYTYETMTPVEIGYAYVESAATDGACKVFETREVIEAMKANGAEESLIDSVNDMFNNRKLHEEIDCPSYLDDIFMELTPIPQGNLTDGVYYMENIDSGSDEQYNSGV